MTFLYFSNVRFNWHSYMSIKPNITEIYIYYISCSSAWKLPFAPLGVPFYLIFRRCLVASICLLSSWISGLFYLIIIPPFFFFLFFFFFFFVTNITYSNKGTKSFTRKNIRGKGILSTINEDRRSGKGISGKENGNAAQENSCRCPKCHMVGTEVCTSVKTFLTSQEEEAGSDAMVAAMTEFICQSWERAGVFKAAMTTDESPSKEKVLRSCDDAKKAASWATRASPKLASHGGLI